MMCRKAMWQKVRETPYQIAYGFLSGIYGLAALCAGTEATPSSVDDAMPLWVAMAWLLSTGFGGIIMLVGRLYEWGEVEAAGLTIQAGGIICYITGLAIIWHAGGNAIFGMVAYLAILFATFVRLSTVRKAIAARNLASGDKGG